MNSFQVENEQIPPSQLISIEFGSNVNGWPWMHEYINSIIRKWYLNNTWAAWRVIKYTANARNK